MIDLQHLQSAMTDISSVGHYEHEFVINGKLYVLSPLTADQDREVFEYAQIATEEGGPKEEGEENTATSIAYMDRFRIAAISQALVVIGDLDLRGADEIFTGRTLDNGTHEKVSRYQGVRLFVEQWKKPLIEQFFIQFGEMSRRAEEQAQNAVRYTPADLSAEIDHIGERLEWANSELQKHERPDPDLSAKVHRHMSAMTELQSRQRSVLAGVTPRTAEAAPVESAPVVEEKPEVPQPPSSPQRPRAPEAFTAAERPIPTPRLEHELEPLQPLAHAAPPSPSLPVHAAPPVHEPEVSQPPPRPQRPSPLHPRPAPEVPFDPRTRTVAPPVSREDRPPPRPPAPEVQPQGPSPGELEQEFHHQNPDIQPGEDLSRYTQTGDSLMGDDEASSIEAEGRRQALLRRQRIERELATSRAAEEEFHQQGPRTEVAQPGVAAPGQVQVTPGGVMVAPGQVIPGQQQRAPRPPVRAPHREAADVQSSVDAARQAAGVSQIGGVPVQDLERGREMITPRTKAENRANRAGKVVVDAPGSDQSMNPRFVGRARRR